MKQATRVRSPVEDNLMFVSITYQYFFPTITYRYIIYFTRVVDPDPDWIRIQSGLWIRIRNPDPDPGGQK